jgi:hypothetical protein
VEGVKYLTDSSWVLTFLLSLIASILYLVLESFFRFHVDVSTTTVNIGYGISIFALTLNILALTAFLILEYRAMHPRQDYFDSEDDISELSEQDVQTVLQIAKGSGIASRTLHTLIANNGHVKQSRKTSVKP